MSLGEYKLLKGYTIPPPPRFNINSGLHWVPQPSIRICSSHHYNNEYRVNENTFQCRVITVDSINRIVSNPNLVLFLYKAISIETREEYGILNNFNVPMDTPMRLIAYILDLNN